MTRSSNLYISPQLHRWLKWLAEMRVEESPNITPDAVAEEILRKAIVAQLPGIEAAEADYWKARRKLDADTVGKLTPVAPLQEAIEKLTYLA